MGRASRAKQRKRNKLDLTDEDVLNVILDAAFSTTARKPTLSPTHRIASMTLGSLTAAKLLLRVERAAAGEFSSVVWEKLEQRSDDLATEYFELLTTGSEAVPGIRLNGEREYLHLVRNRTGKRWCPETIGDHEPSPFPEGMISSPVPETADEIEWEIVKRLAETRRDLKSRGTGEQRTRHMIAETIALMAAAKLHLAIWGNGKLSAAFETLADRCAEQEANELTWNAPREPTSS